jgi:hypothetical protein
MVILIRLRVHDDRVTDFRLAHERHVAIKSLRRRAVSGVWVVCEFLGIEQVNVRVYEDARRPSCA